jgi:hypothetical protein
VRRSCTTSVEQAKASGLVASLIARSTRWSGAYRSHHLGERSPLTIGAHLPMAALHR